MQVFLIDIGNSKGIRLTKNLLKKYNIKERVELTCEKGRITIEPVAKPRQRWEEAFQRMHENGDDRLLINDLFDDENP